MSQKFMLLFLTPITPQPVCHCSVPGRGEKNDLWQWPEASVEFLSCCHGTCAGITVCIRCQSLWRFISALSSKSESLLCVPIFTEPSVDACCCSRVCTSPVTPAEWQKGANGYCYARLPEHLLCVTLLSHCHLAPSDSTGDSALLFQFFPPNLHLMDAVLLPRADEWFTLWRVWIAAF